MDHMAHHLDNEEGQIFEKCLLGHMQILSELAKRPSRNFILKLPDIIEVLFEMKNRGRARAKFIRRAMEEWEGIFQTYITLVYQHTSMESAQKKTTKRTAERDEGPQPKVVKSDCSIEMILSTFCINVYFVRFIK